MQKLEIFLGYIIFSIVYLEMIVQLGLVFDEFSLFCDDRNELEMTSITRNS